MNNELDNGIVLESNEVVIIGGGGHAKVVVDVLRQSSRMCPRVCVAKRGEDGKSVLGVPVICDETIFEHLLRTGINKAFVAVGSNRLRVRLIETTRDAGFDMISVVSHRAYVADGSRVGSGALIMPGAVVGADAVLGDGVIVNTGASVDHDNQIDDGCHIAPGATLAGCVQLESEVFVGAGATIIPNIKIGHGSVIGAGAVVVKDIPANAVAYGNPARVHSYHNKVASKPVHDQGGNSSEKAA